jgi:hypothetical protein
MFSDPPDDRCLAYYPPTIPSMRSLENRCSQFFRYGEERTHPPAFARQMRSAICARRAARRGNRPRAQTQIARSVETQRLQIFPGAALRASCNDGA